MADVISPRSEEMDQHHEQNGFQKDNRKVNPLTPRSSFEGLWQTDSPDAWSDARSQRRHFNNFNKSTAFDFLKGPSDDENNKGEGYKQEEKVVFEEKIVIEHEQKQQEENGGEKEHKQKRHFVDRNRSNFVL